MQEKSQELLLVLRTVERRGNFQTKKSSPRISLTLGFNINNKIQVRDTINVGRPFKRETEIERPSLSAVAAFEDTTASRTKQTSFRRRISPYT